MTWIDDKIRKMNSAYISFEWLQLKLFLKRSVIIMGFFIIYATLCYIKLLQYTDIITIICWLLLSYFALYHAVVTLKWVMDH